MSYRGRVESYLSDKSQIKLLNELLPIHIQLFTNDSNSKMVTSRVWKIHQWICRMCMSGESFLKMTSDR